jgi:hypothetical protein
MKKIILNQIKLGRLKIAIELIKRNRQKFSMAENMEFVDALIQHNQKVKREIENLCEKAV